MKTIEAGADSVVVVADALRRGDRSRVAGAGRLLAALLVAPFALVTAVLTRPER